MNDMRWLPLIFALLAAMGYFGFIMLSKVRLLMRAQHRERYFQHLPQRFGNVMVNAFGQKKMFKEKSAGLMHAFIFWGFMVLQIRTLYVMAVGFFPQAHLPLISGWYDPLKDITGLVVLVMVGWAVYRRVVTKPARLSLSGEAIMILGLIGGLMVSDMLLDGFAFALSSPEHLASNASMFPADAAAHAPIGGLLGKLFAGIGTGTLMGLQEIAYWIHIGIVLVFLNLLPGSKLFHVLN